MNPMVAKQLELSQRERRINESEKLTKGADMRDHYDFSESVKNPYAEKLKSRSRSGLMKMSSRILRIWQKKKIFLSELD